MKKVSGSYTNSYRYKDFVLKKIVLYGGAEKILYDCLFGKNIIESINEYYDDLMAFSSNANLKIARMLDIYTKNDILVIKQEWIEGETIEQFLEDHATKYFFTKELEPSKKLFCNILEIQKQLYKSNKNLRIDWNLKNFIIKESDLFLVDITPPIYVDRIPKTHENPCINTLFELYKSMNTASIAILSYWIKPYIENAYRIHEDMRRLELLTIYCEFEKIAIRNCVRNRNNIAEELEYIKCLNNPIDKFKVFHLRIRAIIKYLGGYTCYNELLNEYKSYSLRKLLDESQNEIVS